MAFMLGIRFLSLQASSLAVESESHVDDVVVITVDSTNLQFSPSEVVITEGQTVRFFWSGEFLEHNAIDNMGFFGSGSPETEEVLIRGSYYYYICPYCKLSAPDDYFHIFKTLQYVMVTAKCCNHISFAAEKVHFWGEEFVE